MYVEDRLFSENTEELLYSVLMNEEEYGLFSEFQKEFGFSGIGKRVLKKAKRFLSGTGKKDLELAKKNREIANLERKVEDVASSRNKWRNAAIATTGTLGVGGAAAGIYGYNKSH